MPFKKYNNISLKASRCLLSAYNQRRSVEKRFLQLIEHFESATHSYYSMSHFLRIARRPQVVQFIIAQEQLLALQVRHHASGCLALQSDLAARALEHVDNETADGMSFLKKSPTGLLGSSSGRQKLPDIKLPPPSGGIQTL